MTNHKNKRRAPQEPPYSQITLEALMVLLEMENRSKAKAFAATINIAVGLPIIVISEPLTKGEQDLVDMFTNDPQELAGIRNWIIEGILENH